MPHRDDLEAAHARIAALERELAAARKEVPGVASDTARKTPASVPDGLEIDDQPDLLRISWHWRISVAVLFALLLLIAIFAALTASGARFDGGLVAACIVLGGFGLLLAFRLAAQCFNRTVIEVSGGELRIRIGPLSLQTPPPLARREIDQIVSVQHQSRHGAWCELYAQLTNGQRMRLIGEIDAEHALYLEHAIEQRLGIVDRPVEGEIPRRP